MKRKRRRARVIPDPILNAIQRKNPEVLDGFIDGDDVYLIIDTKAVRYIADPDFKTAMRVWDSGIKNWNTLCDGGFDITLRAPSRRHQSR